MLEKIVRREFYLKNRHLAAPLLAERETYLTPLYERGLSRQYLLSQAEYLLLIVEYLNLKDGDDRKITLKEIEVAGREWAAAIKNHPMKRKAADTSQSKFILIAVNWLGSINKIDRYSNTDNILSSVFSRVFHKRRYLTYPLLDERLAYLTHWKGNGASLCTLRMIAKYQLHVIDYLGLAELRTVSDGEIVDAALMWQDAAIPESRKKVGRKESGRTFLNVARGWLNFIGQYLPEPDVPEGYEYIQAYLDHIVTEKGYSTRTRDTRDSMLKTFFRYMENRHLCLKNLSLQSVDKYLEQRHIEGCSRRTVAGIASVLRNFLDYAQQNRWCQSGLKESIMSPRCYRMESLPSHLTWDQVRDVIDNHPQESPTQIRDHAILLLLSVYGLRCSEVTNMKLSQIDWRREIIHLNRAKGCKPQDMPLVKSVGDAILTYIKDVRHNEMGRGPVFLNMRAPYGKMSTSTIYKIVRNELKRPGVNLKHYGPHALRHSCATHLVNSGHTMKEVADLLGHQLLDTTRIYAKVELNGLRRVADMNWEGVL